MCVVFYIILILVYFSVNNGRAQKMTPFPFPTLVDLNELKIGKPYFTFDGVNYDLIPRNIINRDFKNCYEEYTRCTRFLVYPNPVCGYHRYENRLWSFYSLCELDLASCKDMKRRKIHMHGINYRFRGVYFLGEGSNCEIHNLRIKEGLVPRDIRDPPGDGTIPSVALKSKYDVVTTAIDLRVHHNKVTPKYNENSEYDYGGNIY